MLYDLSGKVVLVTGGAVGIGFSCAREVLRNGAQAVTIADINALKGESAIKQLTREFGPNKSMFVKTDVTKPEDLEEAFKTTVRTWNSIDVVINNAGILQDANWELEIATNATAVVRGTLLGLQYMGKDKGGTGGVIVNIASILGFQPAASRSIYVGTKHFVVGFSRSMGTQYHYDRTGVKIVIMCPGRTDTDSVGKAGEFAFTALAPDIGELLVKQLSELPLQPTENVARNVIKLITEGDNGSVWVAERNEPAYPLDIPDWRTFRKS